MAASPIATFDITSGNGGARRPSLNDVGGAQLQDSTTKPPPRGGSHLYADMPNGWQCLLAALGRMCPLAILTIDYASGSPIVARIQSPGSDVIAGTFTLTLNSTGDVTIGWATSALPAITSDPQATINDSSGLTSPVVTSFVVASPPANTTQIRSRAFNATVATNIRHTIAIF